MVPLFSIIKVKASSTLPRKSPEDGGAGQTTAIGVKRQSGLRDNFWLFQSLA